MVFEKSLGIISKHKTILQIKFNDYKVKANGGYINKNHCNKIRRGKYSNFTTPLPCFFLALNTFSIKSQQYNITLYMDVGIVAFVTDITSDTDQ
jgi:hypothetical protein